MVAPACTTILAFLRAGDYFLVLRMKTSDSDGSSM